MSKTKTAVSAINWQQLLADLAALAPQIAALLAQLFGNNPPPKDLQAVKAALKAKGCPDNQVDLCCMHLCVVHSAAQTLCKSMECYQACCEPQAP
jgi:hypothetical protein